MTTSYNEDAVTKALENKLNILLTGGAGCGKHFIASKHLKQYKHIEYHFEGIDDFNQFKFRQISFDGYEYVLLNIREHLFTNVNFTDWVKQLFEKGDIGIFIVSISYPKFIQDRSIHFTIN